MAPELGRGTPASRDVEQLRQEMMAYVEGRLSFTNIYPNTPEYIQAVAVLDAMEVVKRAAAIVALAAELQMRRAD